MHPLFFVTLFLALLALLTGSEVKRHLDHALQQKVIQEVKLWEKNKELLKEKAHLLDLKGRPTKRNDFESIPLERPPKPTKTPSKRPRPQRSFVLEFDIHRPPDNARVNIFLVACQDRPELERFYQETFRRLLTRLYGNCPFFTDIPNLPNLLIEKFKAEREKIVHFKFPDELATLQFNDAKAQAALYQMLKGSKTHPSLLNYLSLNKALSPEQRGLNIMFAPKEILEVIFDDPTLAQRIWILREQMWADIGQQKKGEIKELNRTIIKQRLSTTIKGWLTDAHLDPELYPFDYGLGKAGDVFQFTDTDTSLFTREKYFKRLPRSR